MQTPPVQKLTLQQLEHRLAQLPLLPAMVMQLMQLDPRHDQYFEQVESLLRADPAFAIRVLKFANSAAVAPSRRVTSLEQALLLVGCGGAVGLVLAHSAVQIFLPRHPWERNLWRHAFDVALLAETLAPFLVDAAVNPQRAYLTGLLHDIGRFILYLQAPEELRRVDETGWGSPEALVQAELRLCGFTHAELGYLALKRWSLSDALVEIIRHHHDAPPFGGNLSPADSALITLLGDADWISVKLAVATDLWRTLSDAELTARLAGPAMHARMSISGAELAGHVRLALAKSHAQQQLMGVGA